MAKNQPMAQGVLLIDKKSQDPTTEREKHDESNCSNGVGSERKEADHNGPCLCGGHDVPVL
jgi:hypothetical protein